MARESSPISFFVKISFSQLDLKQVTTEYRYPRPETVRRYLSGIGQDAETFSQRRLASTEQQITALESRLDSLQSEVDSIENDGVYELFYSDVSESEAWVRWKISKTTASHYWLEPRHGGKLLRLPKEPLLNGEIVTGRQRRRFALGRTVREMQLEIASQTSDVLGDYYLELVEIQTAIETGGIPLPDHIHNLLLSVEDFFLPHGESIPATVD